MDLQLQDVNSVSQMTIRYFIFKTISLFFGITTFLILLLNKLEVSFSLISISFIEIYYIKHIFTFYTKKSRKYFIYFTICNLMDFVFKISVIILKECRVYISFALVIAVFHIVFCILFKKVEKSIMKIWIILLNNLFFYVSLLIIFLRYDGLINVEMNEVFSPVWLLFCTIILVNCFYIRENIASFKELWKDKISFGKYFRNNFFFFSSLIFVSTHLTSFIILTKIDISLNIYQNEAVLLKASVGFFVFYILEFFYLIFCQKHLKNLVSSNFTIINVNEEVVNSYGNNTFQINTEAPFTIPNISNRLEIQTHNHLFMNNNEIQNNQNKKLEENVETKDILSKYIKHCLPKHLYRKNSCYFVKNKEEIANDVKEIETPQRVVIKRFMSQEGNNILIREESKATETKFTKIERITFEKNNKTINENKHKLELKKGESGEISIQKCIICYENEPDAVLMDCGHGGMCYECCLKLWKKGDNCLICRQKIKEVLQISADKQEKNKFIVETATFALDENNLHRLYNDFKEKKGNQVNSNVENQVIANSVEQRNNLNVSIIDL